jgi:hypothetical protein
VGREAVAQLLLEHKGDVDAETNSE